MRGIMERILKFELGEETVANFNEIFSENKLEGFLDDEIVTIGKCCSPETRRELKIGDKTIIYDFGLTELEVESERTRARDSEINGSN